jgi:hypothetical protein
MRHGYWATSIGSVNEYLVPSNYHKPTDTPENVDYDSVADATKLAYAVAEELTAANSRSPSSRSQ